MPVQNIQLNGLTCGSCVKLIEMLLGRLADVQEVEVEVSGATRITAGREIPTDEIKRVLADTPYSVIEAE